MIRQIIHTIGYKIIILILRLSLIYILAQTFSPNDFGAYSIIITTYTFLMLISGFSLSTYLARVIPGQDTNYQLRVFKTTFLFEVILTTFFVIIFTISGGMKVILPLIKISNYADAFLLGLCILITTVAATEIINYLWAKLKITCSNRVDFLIQAAWVIPLFICWLLGNKMTITGVLSLNVLGVILGIFYGFYHIDFKRWWYSDFDLKILKEALLYSAPLIIPAISVTAMRFADRYILSYYHNLYDVGIYSFAFNFLNTLYTFSAVVIYSNMMPRITSAHNLNDFNRRNIFLFNTCIVAVLIFCMSATILMLFSPIIIALIARPEYLSACEVIPMLAIGNVMIILNYPGHTLLSLRNQTFLLMWIDLFCFLIGLGVSFTLIPPYSYRGAAWALVITFGLAATLKAYYAKIWKEIHFRNLIFLGKLSSKKA